MALPQPYKKELAKQLLLTRPDLESSLLSQSLKRKFAESASVKSIIPKKRLIRKKDTQTISLLEGSVNTEEADQLERTQQPTNSLHLRSEGQRAQS